MILLILSILILNNLPSNALMNFSTDNQCPELIIPELEEIFNVFLLLDDADYSSECFVRTLHQSNKLTITLQYHQPPKHKIISNLKNYDIFIFKSKHKYTLHQLENMELFKKVFKYSNLRKVFIIENIKDHEFTNKNFDTLIIDSSEPKLFDKIFVQTEKLLKFGLQKERDKYLGGHEFRVTVFHCPPFVYINEDDGEVNFDGVEYQFFREITEGWNVSYNIRKKTDNIPNLWNKARQDIIDDVSDMIFCSLWMTEAHYKQIKISKFYDKQCTTFLVPVPKLLPAMSSIHLPFEKHVWFMFAFCIFITALFILLTVYITVKINPNCCIPSLFRLDKCLLEMVNMATAHGLPKFPILLPIRFIVTSWMVMTILLGTAYTTGYTSQLTRPLYSKPIKTIQDMVEQDIIWGTAGNNSDAYLELFSSGNPYYVALAKNRKIEYSMEETYKNFQIEKYAKLVKRSYRTYITEIEPIEYTSKLQLLEECFLSVYIAFGFSKDLFISAYFDNKITNFFEGGLFQYWYTQMTIKHEKLFTRMFLDKNVGNQEEKYEPQSLTLEQLMGAFHLLIVGLSFAFLFFIFELIANIKIC